jgi:ubiquinone/menaquinone biosynthesis C-methylase UbiE
MRTGSENGRLWGANAQDWADFQEAQFRPVAEAVLARSALGPGVLYLDVGCGAGLAVQLAAARGAQVSGIDAAEGMLAIARGRVPHGDFHQADLEELPFASDTFDVVTGFNSFQFAGDAAAALREAGRVAKPGGTVAIVTWSEPERMEASAIARSLKGLLPPPLDQAPGPFALSDETRLRALAAEAGLEVADSVEFDCAWHYRDVDFALRALHSTGSTARAIELLGFEPVDRAHRDALTPFRQPDGSFRVHALFRCLFTRA